MAMRVRRGYEGAAWLKGCGVAMWLARRVRIPPGTPPLVQPRKIQEQKRRGRFFPAQQQEIPAQQQACQLVTKDEYCINTVNTVDIKLQNKSKRVPGRAPKFKKINLIFYQCAVILKS